MRAGWLFFMAAAMAAGVSCARGYTLTGAGGSGGPGGGGGAGAGTTTSVVTTSTSTDVTSTTSSTGIMSGTKAWGDPCTGQFDCGPSTICVGGGAAGICDKFCDSDADCTSMGGFCAVKLSDGTTSGSIQGVTLCTNDCDPTVNTGCPAGMTCRIGQEQTGQMRWFGICGAAGTLGQGSSCTSGNDCLPRFDCFGFG